MHHLQNYIPAHSLAAQGFRHHISDARRILTSASKIRVQGHINKIYP